MKQNVYEYSYELRRERQNRLGFFFLVVISVIVFISLVLNFLIFPVHVKTDSMEKEVASNGVLFVTPLDVTPERGEIIYISRSDHAKNKGLKIPFDVLVKFFTAQQTEINSSSAISGKPCLRRVVGMPGDTIYMKDYILYIKPKGQNQFLTEYELVKKPYELQIYSVPASWNDICSIGNFSEMTLAEDEYFVLADNRVQGTDSRIWGSIKSSRIAGKALWQYFPLKRLNVF